MYLVLASPLWVANIQKGSSGIGHNTPSASAPALMWSHVLTVSSLVTDNAWRLLYRNPPLAVTSTVWRLPSLSLVWAGSYSPPLCILGLTRRPLWMAHWPTPAMSMSPSGGAAASQTVPPCCPQDFLLFTSLVYTHLSNIIGNTKWANSQC